MLIHIKELSSESSDLHEVKDTEWLAASLTGPAARPAPGAKLDVSVRAHAYGGNVFIQGHLKTELILQCARCATEWMQPTEYDFQQTLSPAHAETPEEKEEVELTRDDVDFNYYTGERVDLDPTLREELILQTPEFPLCKADCKGLCPNCGADLNKTTCQCEAPGKVDPRFAALQKIQIKK
jgi:uncharacterized protein